MPMNFTVKSLKAAYSGLEHLSEKRFEKLTTDYIGEGYAEVFTYFKNDLDDDLNTAEALGILWQLVGLKGTGSRADKMADILGIGFLKQKKVRIPQKITKLLAKREKFRSNKQFIQADNLRKEIEELGYRIEDTTAGHKVLRKSEARNPKS